MAEISVDASEDPTPICRCRVLYMGSAVPHITKDGLQGIQEPLKELYPEQGAFEARGIDSWLSVWSNGILLENVDENHKKITRFFPIETLHFCAAVRYVLVPERNNPATPRFLPLDSPFAHGPNPNHPPLFAAILRRTSGIKVLECHAFISKVEAAANALVRCCFHAYADSSYAKQIDERNIYGTVRGTDTIDRVEGWRRKNRSDDGSQTLNTTSADYASTMSEQQITLPDEMSIYNGDENHKVWAGVSVHGNTYNQSEYNSTLRSERASRPRQAVSYVPPPLPPARENKKKGSDPKRETPTNKRPLQGNAAIQQQVLLYHQQLREQHYQRQQQQEQLAQQQQPPRHRNARICDSRPMTAEMIFVPPPPPHVLNNGAVMPPMYGSATMRPYLPLMKNNGTMVPPHAQKIMFNNGTLPPPPPPLLLNPHLHPSTMPHPKSKRKKEQYAGTFSHREHHYNARPVFIPVQPGPGPKPPVPMLLPMPTTHGKRRSNGNVKNKMEIPGQFAVQMVADRNPRMQALSDDEEPPSANGPTNDDESPFNTGIYRKKGHLNERAFSYSIRQEHRSRSYGSLANLQFAPAPTETNKQPPSEEMQSESRNRSYGSLENLASRSPVKKKFLTNPELRQSRPKRDRGLMQIMNDLEISGDELERSEVPTAVYQSRRLAAIKANAAKLRK